MNSDLILHELTGSPNNVKVRMALGIKGLTYQRIPVVIQEYPGDRSEVIEASGQPLTPVLIHGDPDGDHVVVYDSNAILRYLDGNFPGTPRLYSADFAEMRAIEDWEHFQVAELGPPVGQLFAQALEGPDEQACAKISHAMHDATARIEAALEQHPFLIGEQPTAADAVCAAYVGLALQPESMLGQGPIGDFFIHHFHLGSERERTGDWVDRMRAYDPYYASHRVGSA